MTISLVCTVGNGQNLQWDRGPGVTSGLGGRVDLRRSSFGSWPRGKNAVVDLKQTKKQNLMSKINILQSWDKKYVYTYTR